MGQTEIAEQLKKEDHPLSVGEISILLDDNQKKVSRCIARMLKYHEIKYIEIDRIIAMEKYKCKHQMRLWFVDGSC